MRIVFVCSGNTCRSPMAEGYLKSFNIPGLTVLSRGFGFDGDGVSENSVLVMKEAGIDISSHRSKAVTREDLTADRIYCMTASHRSALISAGAQSVNIEVLGGGISDPYGGGVDVYRKCRDEIFSAVNDIVFGGKVFGVEIIKAATGDAKDIAALENECFSQPWSQNAVNESMTAGTHFFIAKSGCETAGYIGISTVLDEGYITNVAVHEKYRLKGVGTLLLNRVIALAREKELSFISLEVRKSNETATVLYSRMGFRPEGIRTGFYRNPKEDAIIMTRRFNDFENSQH